MEELELKTGISIKKHCDETAWSFGICFSHCEDETYLYINFYRWNISIGKFYM